MEQWERIVNFYHSTRRPVNVFVTYHADAAAAASTFISLFRSSLITFNVHPVASYNEVKDVVNNVNEANEFSSLTEVAENKENSVKELFLLIGLGSTVVLRDYFDFTCHMVMVLDSYRPFHLDNLRNRSNANLFIWNVEEIVEQVRSFLFSTHQKQLRERRKRHRQHVPKLVKSAKRGQERQKKHTREVDQCDSDKRQKLLMERYNKRSNGSTNDAELLHHIGNTERTGVRINETNINRENSIENSVINNNNDDDDDDADDDNNNVKNNYENNYCSGSSLCSSLGSSNNSDSSGTSSNDSYCSDDDDDDDDDYNNSEEEYEDDDDNNDDNYYTSVENHYDGNWEEEGKLPNFMEKLYYATEKAGTSCAVAAYELAKTLNRYKDIYLWHAAVGVCDLYRRRLIDYSTYLIMMRPLHDIVTLQKTLRHQEVLNDLTNTAAMERTDDQSITNDNDVNINYGYGYNYGTTRQRLRSKAFAATSMRLENKAELQLFLLNHGSLWDAIWLEPFIASVLKLHHAEEGKGFLAQLLASKCGVSLEKARKPWREWLTDEQKKVLVRVHNMLNELVERKNLHLQNGPNIIETVVRKIGYSTPVSTIDACTLFEAVLASNPPASLFVVEYNVNELDNLEMRWKEQQVIMNKRVHDFRRQQFWKAFAVLDADSNEILFQQSIREALMLYNSVAQATAALMQPGIVQTTKGIHYALPNDPNKTISSLEQFSSVYKLAVLAKRLLFTLTIEYGVDRYTRHVRPLLLCCATPKLRKVATSASEGKPVRTNVSLLPSFSSFSSELSIPQSSSERRDTTMITNNSNNGSSKGNNGFDIAQRENASANRSLRQAVDAECTSANTDNNLFTNLTETKHYHESHVQGMYSENSSFTVPPALMPTEDTKYVVMLVHEGATQSNLTPLSSLGRFYQCISDEEEFAVLPERSIIDRNCVEVWGRENTMHLAELMHLISLKPWKPSRELSSNIHISDHEGYDDNQSQ